jgi:hypothetical protein
MYVLKLFTHNMEKNDKCVEQLSFNQIMILLKIFII